MSGATIGSLPARKSFAQVAAAANRHHIQKEKPTKEPPADEIIEPGLSRIVQSSAPRINLPETITGDVCTEEIPADVGSKTQDVTADGIASALQATSLDSMNIVVSTPIDGFLKKDNSDTKSIASRTTLTLDEKESLRPDDSASMHAAVEGDASSPSLSMVTNSKPDSDPDACAFREQLDQIGLNGNGRVIMPRAQRPERIGEHETRGIIFPPSLHASAVASSQPTEEDRPRETPPSMWVVPPDPKLCEALESPNDRLFVLKVEQDLIDFVKDPKEEFLQLPGTNSFYRMLSHKLADYYMLGHIVDDTMSSVRIYRTPHTRLPPPLINSTPRTSDNTPPPTATARKIMRRNGTAKMSGRRDAANEPFDSLTSSKATSDLGSDADDTKDGKAVDRGALTREERESRYKEARARIFKDFEEKEKEEAVNGEKDLSRSSSTSGAKKNKKQRKPKDDAFEARSAFDALGRRISDNGYPQSSTEATTFEQYFFEQQGQFGLNAPQFPPSQPFPIPSYNTQSNDGINMNHQWPPQVIPAAGFPSAPYIMGSESFGQEQQNVFSSGFEGNQFSPNMSLERTPKGTAPVLSNFGQGYMQPSQMGWSQDAYASGYPGPDYQYQDFNGNYNGFYATGMMPQSMSLSGFNAFSPQQTTPNYNQAYFPGNFDPAPFDPRSRAFIPSVHNGSNPQYAMGPFSPGQIGYAMQQQPSSISGSFPGHLNPNGPQPSSHVGGTHYRKASGGSRGRTQAQTSPNSNPRSQGQSFHPPSSIAKWAAPANLPAKPPAPSVVSGSQPLPPKPVATR